MSYLQILNELRAGDIRFEYELIVRTFTRKLRIWWISAAAVFTLIVGFGGATLIESAGGSFYRAFPIYLFLGALWGTIAVMLKFRFSYRRSGSILFIEEGIVVLLPDQPAAMIRFASLTHLRIRPGIARNRTEMISYVIWLKTEADETIRLECLNPRHYLFRPHKNDPRPQLWSLIAQLRAHIAAERLRKV